VHPCLSLSLGPSGHKAHLKRLNDSLMTLWQFGSYGFSQCHTRWMTVDLLSLCGRQRTKDVFEMYLPHALHFDVYCLFTLIETGSLFGRIRHPPEQRLWRRWLMASELMEGFLSAVALAEGFRQRSQPGRYRPGSAYV
jgi:hypothetical protein